MLLFIIKMTRTGTGSAVSTRLKTATGYVGSQVVCLLVRGVSRIPSRRHHLMLVLDKETSAGPGNWVGIPDQCSYQGVGGCGEME